MMERVGRVNLDSDVLAQAQNLDPQSVDLLWTEFLTRHDAGARETLILHHMPYARMVAGTYYGKRFNDEIAFEDYLQWATVGMIESLDRFDPSHGVQFKNFAARRMYGAILDGIESATEKQEQIALRARLRKDRLESIKRTTDDRADGRSGVESSPTKPESALSYLAEVGIGLALAWMLEDTGLLVADENVADTRHIPYLQALEVKQLQEQILNLVETLPIQQQTVIRGHYLDEKPFEQIATQLGLTKGRISQIHKQALMRLRTGLNGQQKCNIAM